MHETSSPENSGTNIEKSEHPLLKWVEQINASKDSGNQEFAVKQKEFAIQQLEAKFKRVDIIQDNDIQVVFDQLDNEVRNRLVKTIIESNGFKGEFKVQDATGKMLTVELANPPVTRDATHGWVIKYKAWDNPQDKYSTATKSNFISAMARFKANTPKTNEGTHFSKAS